MRRAPSLGQLSGAWDALNWPKGAQSSSTKLASYLPKPRSLCCAFCRNASLSASAEPAPSELMFGLLRLLTATWKLPSLLASSGATYFTGSTYFRLRYPLCGNARKTFPCWWSISLIATQGGQERVFRRSTRKASICSSRTPGRVTFVNCRTWSSDPSLFVRQGLFQLMKVGFLDAHP